MTAPAVLAVDVGTSAVRAAVVTGSGEILASRHTRRPDDDAGRGFDAEVMWKQVVDTAASVTGGHRAEIGAIGIAGHIGTVLVDRTLDPVGLGYGWADDRGRDEVQDLLGPRTEELLRVTGRPRLTGGALPALVHQRVNDRDTFARVAHALQPKDFLVARLTGRVVTDHTSAAYFGASAVRTREWATELVDEIGIDPALLPSQHASTDPVGTLSVATGRLIGLPAGVPVVGGGPDGTLGATLVLGREPGAIADIAGTTDVFVRVVDAPDLRPAGTTLNPYTLGNRWTVGGATGMTGGAVVWAVRLLGYTDPAQALDRLGADFDRLGPGAGGLLADPSLSGSRFPRWHSTSTGSLHGLRADHGPAHLLLAMLEGAAFTVREAVDTLATNEPHQTITTAGGTARSPWLCQLRADVLGRDVTVCTEPDVSLIGAALVALLVGRGDESHWVDEHVRALRGPLQRYSPEPGRAAAYAEAYQRWRSATGQRG